MHWPDEVSKEIEVVKERRRLRTEDQPVPAVEQLFAPTSTRRPTAARWWDG